MRQAILHAMPAGLPGDRGLTQHNLDFGDPEEPVIKGARPVSLRRASHALGAWRLARARLRVGRGMPSSETGRVTHRGYCGRPASESPSLGKS